MSYASVKSEMEYFNQRYNEYIQEVRERSNRSKLEDFAEMRGFKISTLDEIGIFYVGDPVELLVPKYMDMVEQFGVISPTNKKPIYHNRYVIPIRNVYGDVINVVGYSKDANERYVYGTATYYRRRDDMWGLEKLHKAYELGYAIYTEGITDAIALRDIGYDVAFANCGTHAAPIAMRQLNRCRYGIIKVPDRDPAGQSANKKWKCCRSITLNTFVAYKDMDEMIHADGKNVAWVKSYIEDCINWLKQKEHCGFDCEKPEVTIY